MTHFLQCKWCTRLLQLIMLIGLLSVLLSCEEMINDITISNEDEPRLELSPPKLLTRNRTINPRNLKPTASFGQQTIVLSYMNDGVWSGQLNVVKNRSYQLVIDWHEDYHNRSLHLAHAERIIEVGDSNISVVLSESDYESKNLDADSDGVSNLEERIAGTDPFTGESSVRFLLSKSEIDYNADGDVDTVSVYSYDSDGNRLSKKTDIGVDGSIDTLYTYTYDSNSNLLSEKREYRANNGINDLTIYTYDGNANRLSKEYDRYADGKIDHVEIYTYDTSGNRLTAESDREPDGVTDSKVIYSYDVNGNRLSEEYDDNADGIAESKVINTYNNNGNLLSKKFDRGVDGVINFQYSYTYDNDKNLLSETYENFTDEVPNYRFIYTYDSNGNMISREYDDHVDGFIEAQTLFSYDTNGNQISEKDVSADGTVQSIISHTWTKL